jgi:cephalosporin-C deacetylase
MKVAVTIAPGFDRFWADALGEALSTPLDDTREVDPAWSSPQVAVEHVSLASLGQARVHGWLFTPSRARHGALLYLPGYSASTHTELLMRVYRQMAAFGFALLGLDPRGQGASTAAHPPVPAGKLLTGITSPQDHIYRGILADCVQGARYLMERATVSRIGVGGHSQGGGLALLTASVAPKFVGSVTAMIPFLTHYRLHAARCHSVGPYSEITTYLRAHPEEEEHLLQVLSYFDTMAHAERIAAPTLLSVGLADTTCPPDSVLALHQALRGTKALITFPEAGHTNSPHFYHHIVQWHRRYLSPGDMTMADLQL